MADILKHLDLNSADGTQLNLDALYQIAPSAFTEVRDDKTGEISRKVNFEVLRRLLGDHATDGDGEMYQFTWVGKNAARAEAAKPTDKTLRPVVENSVDWDNTKNIYIEGDNLEVLKLLQRSYADLPRPRAAVTAATPGGMVISCFKSCCCSGCGAPVAARTLADPRVSRVHSRTEERRAGLCVPLRSGCPDTEDASGGPVRSDVRHSVPRPAPRPETDRDAFR